ncbi:MAG TPA: AraC family transcriptional regulator [Nocardioidaceae bacterium]|nr:AraC family transcriptional regulator [Nocardioidaceae bacterium]
MSTQSDTFVGFVDALARHLDDHDARGEDLAARAYLSRFHFDRVVAAASGETPARFRRRVLLERAAYRLATSESGVLDVAVEAGYSSNEAFTRAFQRAYGLSPSAWRSTPTPILLDTPNGVHFHPPGSLRLPAREEVTEMNLLTKMAEHHVWLVGELVDRASRLTAEQLDTKIRVSVDNEDGTMTTRSILSRLIGQMDMWMCAIEMREYDWSLEQDESVDTMRERLGRVGPAWLAQVHDSIDGGRLDETFVDALCDPPEVFTYGGMVAHVLTFAAYNRTLVVQAMQEAGVTDLGWGDPMKWVAEPAS